MIYYSLLCETWHCHEGCSTTSPASRRVPWLDSRYISVSECPHKKSKRWVSNQSLYSVIGPAHSALKAHTEQTANMEDHTWFTGEAQIMMVDTNHWLPYYNDAEQAAIRIGGIEAGKRMRKKRGA